LHEPSLALVIAAMLQGLGNGHLANGIAARWKLPNRDADRARWLLDHLPIASAALETPWPQLQRVLVNEGSHELVSLAAAAAGDKDAAVQLCRAKLALPQRALNPAPVLTGSDLIAAGFPPGPAFGRLLERVRDAQLEGHVTTKDQALELSRALLDVDRGDRV
jgi:poly(A) polymerase